MALLIQREDSSTTSNSTPSPEVESIENCPDEVEHTSFRKKLSDISNHEKWTLVQTRGTKPAPRYNVSPVIMVWKPGTDPAWFFCVHGNIDFPLLVLKFGLQCMSILAACCSSGGTKAACHRRRNRICCPKRCPGTNNFWSSIR